MIILGLDFETLGLDYAIHSICEVGAVLWDTGHNRSIMSMGYLVQPPADALYEEDALTTTGLSLELIMRYGKESIRGLKQLLYMYEQADVVCAHNGLAFDRKFLLAWIKACELDFDENKLWVDTLVDIEFPKKWNRQLTCLAAYHGFINPFPHQALGDVLTMLTILSKYPLDPILESARTPLIGVRLLNITFNEREWAKLHSYFPYRNKTTGKFIFWMKIIKENKFDTVLEEAKEANYDLEKITIPEGVY